MTDEQLRNDVGRTLAGCFDPIVWEWFGDAARTALRADLDQWLSRRGDAEFGRAVHAGVAIDGTRPDDFLMRTVEVGGDLTALVGNRFFGGDTADRFVETLPARRPETSEQVAALHDAALSAFAKFRPTRVRLFWPAGSMPPLAGTLAADVDQHYLAGRINGLASTDDDAEVTDDVNPAEAVALIATVYESLGRTDPQLRRRLSAADPDTVNKSVAAGLAVGTTTGGRLVGFLAALEEDDLALVGHLVHEEVVHPDARGRRLGARMQRRLIAHLAARRPGAVLHGTIDALNAASLATARRVGRREVLRSVFVSRR